jgi:hypothetical protein
MILFYNCDGQVNSEENSRREDTDTDKEWKLRYSLSVSVSSLRKFSSEFTFPSQM